MKTVSCWTEVLDILKANQQSFNKNTQPDNITEIQKAIEEFQNTIKADDLYNLIANIDQKVRFKAVIFASKQIKSLQELVNILGHLEEEDRLAAFNHCFSEKIGINDADDLQYILGVIPDESRSGFTKRFINKIENIQVFAGQILPKILETERLEIALLCKNLITTPEALHLVSRTLSSEDAKTALKEQVYVTEPNIARRLYTYFKPDQSTAGEQYQTTICRLL